MSQLLSMLGDVLRGAVIILHILHISDKLLDSFPSTERFLYNFDSIISPTLRAPIKKGPIKRAKRHLKALIQLKKVFLGLSSNQTIG